MKAILVSIVIFGIIMACIVVYSVDFGKREVQGKQAQKAPTVASVTPASPFEKAATPAPAPPATRPAPTSAPKSPPVQVIYVPQIIREVRTRDVYNTREIVKGPILDNEDDAFPERARMSKSCQVLGQNYKIDQEEYTFDSDPAREPDKEECPSLTGEVRIIAERTLTVSITVTTDPSTQAVVTAQQINMEVN